MRSQAEAVATSTNRAALLTLRDELHAELTRRILPYWSRDAVDDAQGGFVGLIDRDNIVRHDAPKGAVLNARILWTFSAAYRALGDPALRAMADRAAEYFGSFFIDRVHGGVYWMVDASGRPHDVRKHVYAQSFAIYALSEHYRATGVDRSLRDATDIFLLLERHAYDASRRGYHEAFACEWTPLVDVRMNAARHPPYGPGVGSPMSAVRPLAGRARALSSSGKALVRGHDRRRVPSDEDVGARRSMNTHLHALEACITLHHVWPDALPRDRLRSLLELFLERIIDGDAGHVREFFDEDWTPRPGAISFGHDIETSWLLIEAADADACADLRDRVRHASIRLAETVLDQALDGGGGIHYRAERGHVETYKEWWPQAEAIVGFLNAYEQTGRAAFVDATLRTWGFVQRHVLDHEHGEWHRRVDRDGKPRRRHEKVGPWKGPYHNARACLEGIRRLDRILGQ